MVLPFLVRGGRPQALAWLRSDPGAVEHGLGAVAETLAAYARACLAAGADGLFYATNVATRAQMSAAECRRFQRPFDLAVLAAVEAAPFNLLHVCGEDVLFDEFVDYPVTAFSWALLPGNPSLEEGQRRTGRWLLLGPDCSINPDTPEALLHAVGAALASSRP